MQISLDTSNIPEQDSPTRSLWYDRIWASFIFFTRLPFWRIYQPKKEAYKTVVEHWPLTGWLTGCMMAAVIWFGSMVMPYPIVIILAILTRLLITGALHEDGLADFMDGFGGGGSNRQRILDIMKDSHIGTYGVIALIFYFLLLFFALSSMNPHDAALTVIVADPYAKMLSAQLIQMMPYARTEETAKNHTVYRKFSVRAGISLAIQGLLPIGLYIYYMYEKIDWQMIVFLPALLMYFLYLLIWKRLRGYTGDCCGAMFLLTELFVYLIATYYLG
jgi:cobalamin 5''-phosphate synthase/cobalamin synthase